MNIFQKNYRNFIAKEIARTSRFFSEVSIMGTSCVEKEYLQEALAKYPSPVHPLDAAEASEQSALLIYDTEFNSRTDLDRLLREAFHQVNRRGRLLLVLYNPYYRFLYQIANLLGLRKGTIPKNFMTRSNLDSLAKAAGFEIVQMSNPEFIPLRMFGLGDLINRFLKVLPVLNNLSWITLVYLRPVKPEKENPSISIIVPARNEEGNIRRIVDSIPSFCEDIEVIFVEGNSTDNTWLRIQEIVKEPSVQSRFRAISCLQQPGKGKADAVRVGFAKATGDLLTVLDADLTMPAEDLPRFYDAYVKGRADFINGNRLLYPMESDAMRFINLLGNIFFAKLLSLILDLRINDSLCGTKLFSRLDYERMTAWNHDFGKFDPFGDYEMLFPASALKLGTIDIPIVYKARTYGDTNISRFRDSLKLMRMCMIGFFRMKL